MGYRDYRRMLANCLRFLVQFLIISIHFSIILFQLADGYLSICAINKNSRSYFSPGVALPIQEIGVDVAWYHYHLNWP